MFFIFNPLTCYFYSMYSESSFLLSQVLIIYILQYSMTYYQDVQFRFMLLSLIPLIVGCFIRSNGFLSAGYIVYYLVMSPKNYYMKLIRALGYAVPVVCVSVLPFLVYNIWGFHSVCKIPVPSGAGDSKLCSNYSFGKYLIYEISQKISLNSCN